MGWKPMAVRAARWAFLGVLFAGGGSGGQRPDAGCRPPTYFRWRPTPGSAATTRQTRFVMDLDRKIDLHAFTLADPYRVVLDIPQVTFQLPPKAGETGRGLIKAFRFGLVMPGGSRMVFDVAKPVRVDKAFVIDAADGAPARLVLDLAATDRDSFLRKIAPIEKDEMSPMPKSPAAVTAASQ